MQEVRKIIISGLEIPFWDLVWFMVKLAFASIPAMFIVYFIWMVIELFLGGFFHMIMPIL
ncbi:MAG: hypothetical protein GXO31_09025 [Epsilonproteobacteria bacterium]|nr:hypothetical protein [Campylobacterota bacterium]